MNRKLALLVSALVAVAFVSGCSGGSGDTAAAGNGKPSEQIDTHQKIKMPHASVGGGGAPAQAAPQ